MAHGSDCACFLCHAVYDGSVVAEAIALAFESQIHGIPWTPPTRAEPERCGRGGGWCPFCGVALSGQGDPHIGRVLIQHRDQRRMGPDREPVVCEGSGLPIAPLPASEGSPLADLPGARYASPDVVRTGSGAVDGLLRTVGGYCVVSSDPRGRG